MAAATEWRCLDEAYGFVQPTYSLLSNRVDAINGRIQSFIGFSAPLWVGVILLAEAALKNPDFTSNWFYAAMASAGTSVLGALVALLYGTMNVVSPRLLAESYSDATPEEFKANLVEHAGTDFENTRRLLEHKHRASVAATFLLSIGVVLLVIWIAAVA